MIRAIPLAFLLGLSSLTFVRADVVGTSLDDGASEAGFRENSTNIHDEDDWVREPRVASGNETMCDGHSISQVAIEQMLELAARSDDDDVYITYDRIDGVAALFETCADPRGTFPTVYRRITARGIQAIEAGAFEDEEWARDIVVDFAGLYMDNLALALKGERPSWAWSQYYDLAEAVDHDGGSAVYAVVMGMVAHLVVDLPNSLVAIGTQEGDFDDYVLFGDSLVDVSDLLIDDLLDVYDADAEELLSAFFVGDVVDGALGEGATTAIMFQTVRGAAWTNRGRLDRFWGRWVANAEMRTLFWAIDGALASMADAGAI